VQVARELIGWYGLQYKKTARGLLTASSEFKIPEGYNGTDEVEHEVVIKDRMLDTVAIAKLVWRLEQSEKEQ
jgi:hypothetical protein